METTRTQADIASSTEGREPPAPDRIRIVSTPGTCGGRPRIDGHRITVEDVAIWHERMGLSPDEIVSSRPTLDLSKVYAALAYYWENRERIDADIVEGERFVAEMRAKMGPGPLEERLKRGAVDVTDDSLPPR